MSRKTLVQFCSDCRFETQKNDDEAVEELLRSLQRRGETSSAQPMCRSASCLAADWIPGLLLALMNEHGDSWPAYTVGYGESFADDELADAAETRRSAWCAAHFGQARSAPNSRDRCRRSWIVWKNRSHLHRSCRCISSVSARDRMSRSCSSARARTNCLAVTNGISVSITENVWRGLPSAVRGLASSAVNRLPRNETLKRGVHSLATKTSLQRYRKCFLARARADTSMDFFASAVLLSRTNGDGSSSRGAKFSPRRSTAMSSGLSTAGAAFVAARRAAHVRRQTFHGAQSRRSRAVSRSDGSRIRRNAQAPNFKVRNGKGKWLHRQVCQNYLPPTNCETQEARVCR